MLSSTSYLPSSLQFVNATNLHAKFASITLFGELVLNTLAEGLRISANREYNDAHAALNKLYEVLRQKVGITYKLQLKAVPKDTPENQTK